MATAANPVTSIQADFKSNSAHVEQATGKQQQQQQANSTPAQLAQVWCDKLQAAITAENTDAFVALFREDGWWRDILNVDFDFNTLKTKEIAEHLKKFGMPKIRQLTVIKPDDAAIVPVNDEVTWLSAFLTYETSEGRGKGFVRLRESSAGKGDWNAYTFFTVLWELKGHEEFAYKRRPLGAQHGEHHERKNWLDKRKEKAAFDTVDPTVLIIGGGQNGLMLAARLTALGIDNLIVEKNPRLGDSWRNRYHSLCLHDPVWADHFPYISYPPQWPIYTPKDKMANWFEFYADAMELNVWLKSTIEPNPTYDSKTKKWSVTVNRDGQPRKMQVSHLALASGFSGEAKFPDFPRDEFQGKICHSSQHKGGQGAKGKKALVVGCCNSGHDIAADFYEQGADTTIVQRSSTYVMSSEHGIPGLLNGYYEEGGPPLEDADIMLTSLPVSLLEAYHIEATKAIAEKDKPLLDDLEKAGFKLNRYPGGLFIKYFRDGGGYYIDVGCSRLIADGKIKIKQGKQITKLTKTGALFEDGTHVEADTIVLATGYQSMRTTVSRVISPDVAKKLGPCWGSDEQGEIPSVWRNSGVEHFYLQCGNFFQARCFSKHVALQIQMQEVGHSLAKEISYPKYKEVEDPRF